MQGLVGGGTFYDEQSLEDITDDIANWIKYSDDIRNKLTRKRQKVIDEQYWDNVSYDFEKTINSTISFCKTISSDLQRVLEAINSGKIGRSEISLLKNIGKKSNEYNVEIYPRSYRGDNSYWHDYGNPLFKIVEEMYAEGRDFFVTLQDVSNAADRLEDYMSDLKEINQYNNISISGNVSNSEFIQGDNSIINKGAEHNSEEIMNIISKIQEYTNSAGFDSEFGGNSEKVKALVAETIREINEGNNTGKIYENINKIKAFAENVSAGIIASGIANVLESLFR